MAFIIREARLDDAGIIAEIMSLSWEAAYTGMIPDEYLQKRRAEAPERWRQILESDTRSRRFIAQADGKPVGFYAVAASRDEDTLGCGEIWSIYLHPDCWRQGYGRRMMDHALKTLWESGYQTVVVWTFCENTRARRFYEASGFIDDGSRRMYEYDEVQLEGLRYVIKSPEIRAIDS